MFIGSLGKIFGSSIWISHSSSQVTTLKCEKCHNNANMRSYHLSISVKHNYSHLLLRFLSCSCFIFLSCSARARCSQCCEHRVGSIAEGFMFISLPAVARDGSGAICLIGPFSLQCCDRASVISHHTAQGVRSLCTFHNGDGKSKMEIWPRPLVFREARCILYLQLRQ